MDLRIQHDEASTQVYTCTEDMSSNGSIEDFQNTYSCHICNVSPDTTTATLIQDMWTLEGNYSAKNHSPINVLFQKKILMIFFLNL